MTDLCLSADLHTLTALATHEKQLSLLTVDTSRLWEQRKELGQVTQQFEQISSLLEYLSKAFECLEAQWHEGVKQLNSKMQALKALLSDYGRDTTPEDDLFTLLTSGVPSSALAQFFTSVRATVQLCVRK